MYRGLEKITLGCIIKQDDELFIVLDYTEFKSIFKVKHLIDCPYLLVSKNEVRERWALYYGFTIIKYPSPLWRLLHGVDDK